jgi:hypothetical protein
MVKVVEKCEEIPAIWECMMPLFEVGSVDSKNKDLCKFGQFFSFVAVSFQTSKHKMI